MQKRRTRVYCSGPLFCPEEMAGMTAIADVLEQAGYDTFLPHRDGLEPYVLKAAGDPLLGNAAFRGLHRVAGKAIFALDIYQILEGCDRLVMNMNGRVPDEGAVVEAAVAFTAGKPLVLYKNDHRTKIGGNDNAMLSGLSYTFRTVTHLSRIPAELEETARRLEATGPSPYQGENVPSHMRKVVDLGRRIWTCLSAVQTHRTRPGDAHLDRLKQVVTLCEAAPEIRNASWL